MIAVGWFSTMTSTVQSKPLLKKEHKLKDRFAHVGANYSAISSKLSLKIQISFNVCLNFKITLLEKKQNLLSHPIICLKFCSWAYFLLKAIILLLDFDEFKARP
jgi:hypothetical protein